MVVPGHLVNTIISSTINITQQELAFPNTQAPIPNPLGNTNQHNINERGRSTHPSNSISPCSISNCSSSSTSEITYSKRIEINNINWADNLNMEQDPQIDTTNQNNTPIYAQHEPSIPELSTHMPYAENVPTTYSIPNQSNGPIDYTMWDGDFLAISIYGSIQALLEDAKNITTSLSRIH